MEVSLPPKKAGLPSLRLPPRDTTVPNSSEGGLPARIVLVTVMFATSDTNAIVRAAAVGAAARIADRKALPRLLAALDMPDANVVDAVRKALLIVATPEDMSDVAAAIEGAAPGARVMLLEVLGARRATGQMAAVLNAATDPDASVRKAAFSSLGPAIKDHPLEQSFQSIRRQVGATNAHLNNFHTKFRRALLNGLSDLIHHALPFFGQQVR